MRGGVGLGNIVLFDHQNVSFLIYLFLSLVIHTVDETKWVTIFIFFLRYGLLNERRECTLL